MSAGWRAAREVLKIREKFEGRCDHTNTYSGYLMISRGLWAAAELSMPRRRAAGVVLNLSHLQRRADRTGLLGPESKICVFCARWLIFTAILVVLRAATPCFGNFVSVHGPPHAAAPALAVRPGLLLGAPVLPVRGRVAGLLLVAQIAIDFASVFNRFQSIWLRFQSILHRFQSISIDFASVEIDFLLCALLTIDFAS
jgi:hypothetical protein